MDYRPIFFIIGVLLVMLGISMLIPAIVDSVAASKDWLVFLVSAFFTSFIGGIFILMNRSRSGLIGIRQAFLLTTMSWIITAAFGALPFMFSDLNLTYTDAFFEAMSGITTTGSTVLIGLDNAPPGILLWRALLQWLGGIGIIVMAIAILPMLRVGGMQLFQMESSDRSDKLMPRTAQISTVIGAIYFCLTVACFTAYWAAGMSPFDAVAHSMTTIATGGFSTRDESLGFFLQPAIHWIAVCFMILGSLPFLLYFEAVRGHFIPLWKDTQVRCFLTIVVISILVMAYFRWNFAHSSIVKSLRESAFNVTSIITGTGYSSADYSQWGSLPVFAFFLFMFIGGCAGSTSCSVKVFRFQICFSILRTHILRLWQPNGVFIPYYNHKPLESSVTDAVMVFFFLFMLVFTLLTLALSVMGLDFITSISGAAAAISNVGPALGDVIGPSKTFAPLPDAAKWILSAGMLLGRLEFLTVLILFTPTFWKA